MQPCAVNGAQHLPSLLKPPPSSTGQRAACRRLMLLGEAFGTPPPTAARWRRSCGARHDVGLDLSSIRAQARRSRRYSQSMSALWNMEGRGMTDVPTMDELWRHREKELCAEIERLTELVDMWSGRYASIKTDNDEAVVFLDRL